MRSEGRIGTELPYFEYTPTEEEKELIEQNFNLSHDKGKLKFEKPEHILQEENKKTKMRTIDQLKEDLKKAKNEADLKAIILTLLNNQ